MERKLKEKCPECESEKIIQDYQLGEIICGNCGIVLFDQIIDPGREWRVFTFEEEFSKARSGRPLTYLIHDKGLSTDIGKINFDTHGRKILAEKKFQIWRLKKWQNHFRIYSRIEKNFARAMTELLRLSEKLNLPQHTKETAAILYWKALQKGILIQRRSTKAFVAAILFIACRMTGIVRDFQEIIQMSSKINGMEWNGNYKKFIRFCYRHLIKELLDKNLGIKMPIIDPIVFVPKIAEALGISGEIQSLAIKIIQDAKKKKIHVGKKPVGIAAASLLIACHQKGENLTQKEMANVIPITHATLGNRTRELVRKLNLKLPK